MKEVAVDYVQLFKYETKTLLRVNNVAVNGRVCSADHMFYKMPRKKNGGLLWKGYYGRQHGEINAKRV